MRRVLFLRHGIVINRFLMMPMQRYFTKLGYEVHNRSYRSTRKGIREHADDLSREVKEVEARLVADGEPWEMHFVTHSLGGLVFRYAMTHCPMPPVKRAMLMVPPNRGSLAARHFQNFRPYRWLFGTKAGLELADDPSGIFAECGVPENCEVGIIAGQVPRSLYRIPFTGPHDGVVAVAEAELPPYPIQILPYAHTPILFVRYAWEEAAHFLEHGAFRQRAAGGASGGGDSGEPDVGPDEQPRGARHGAS